VFDDLKFPCLCCDGIWLNLCPDITCVCCSKETDSDISMSRWITLKSSRSSIFLERSWCMVTFASLSFGDFPSLLESMSVYDIDTGK
jgi:hypothetical protein